MFWRTYKFQSRLARIRVRLGQMVLSLLYGKPLSEVARSSVHSVEEWSAIPKIRERIVEVRQIFPASIARYDFDASYPATFRRSKSFDAIKLVRLKNVIVSPQSGLVFLPDKTILQESVGGLIRILGWGRNIHEVLMRCEEAPEGTSGCIVAAPSGIPFFHWLLESYPRLICLLDLLEKPVILVNRDTPSFVLQSIETAFAYLGKRAKIVASDLSITADEAAFAESDDWSGFVHPMIVDLLKDVVVKTVGEVKKGRRIYISRRRAQLRAITNEKSVEEEFERRGFEVCFMEDFDLISQWKIMAEAEEVVAPHGAALSNLVACSPDTKVLELFQSGTHNDCYARLSKALHLEYRYLQLTNTEEDGRSVDIFRMRDALDGLLHQKQGSLLSPERTGKSV